MAADEEDLDRRYAALVARDRRTDRALPFLLALVGLLFVVGTVLVWQLAAANSTLGRTVEQRDSALARIVELEEERQVTLGQIDDASTPHELAQLEARLEQLSEQTEALARSGGPAAEGVPGAAGLPGLTGDRGPRGFDGAPGSRGEPGPIGLRGETGATGAAGPAGGDGAQGPAGADGAAGVNGVDGGQGPPGPPGPAGADGGTGPAGVDGGQGPAGPPGPGPTSFSFTFGNGGNQTTVVCTDPDGDLVYECVEAA